jgi:hypothetical protein
MSHCLFTNCVRRDDRQTAHGPVLDTALTRQPDDATMPDDCACDEVQKHAFRRNDVSIVARAAHVNTACTRQPGREQLALFVDDKVRHSLTNVWMQTLNSNG